MKKSLIILIMLTVLTFSLVGCSGAKQLSQEDLSNANKSNYSMFTRVETGDCYTVVYHNITKVMYVISRGQYNSGTFTVMLNADGTPMLYKDN